MSPRRLASFLALASMSLPALAQPIWYADWNFDDDEGTPLSQATNSGIISTPWGGDLSAGQGALVDGDGTLRVRTSGTYDINTVFWEPGQVVANAATGTVYLTVEFREYVLDQALPSGGYGELMRFSTSNTNANRYAQVMWVLRRNGTTNEVEVQAYHSGSATSSNGTSSAWVKLADTPNLTEGLKITLEINYATRAYALHAKVGQEAWMQNIAAGTVYSGAVLDGLRLQFANIYTQALDQVRIDRISITNESPLDDGEGVLKVAEGTPYESPAYLIDSGEPGPTVFIYGGLNQGTIAPVRETLSLVRQWPLTSGRLIFMPEFRLPVGDPAASTLTTSFPKSADAIPTNPAAAALWAYLSELKPDYMLELRTTTASPWNITNGNYSNVLLASGSDTSVEIGAALQARVDLNITTEGYQYERRTWPATGLVARAAGDFLGTHAINAYVTSNNQTDAVRRNQYVTLVYALLERTEMIEYNSLVPGLPSAVARMRRYDALRRGKLAVAVFDGQGSFGEGVPNVLAELKPRREVFTAVVTSQDIRQGALDHFDVVVFTGGSGGEQANTLDENGRERIRQFVANGGGYLGICAGAYLAMSNYSWGLKIVDGKTRSPLWKRGEGIVEVELTEAGEGLFGDHGDRISINYANGPIIEPAGRDDIAPYEVLGWFRTEMALNGTPVGLMVDTPAFLRGEYGAGRVVLFSPHPEKSPELRSFVSRAVDWAGRVNDTPSMSVSTETIAAGTPYESTAYIVDSGVPGPRVLVHAGIGQTLPTVATAMERLREWPLQRGTLLLVPHWTVPNGDPAATGLTNSFPRAYDTIPTNPAAAAWWSWISSWMPDWSVELRENNVTPWSTSSGSYGNVVLSLNTAEATNSAIAARQRADLLITSPGHRFARTYPPAEGLLARSMGDHLGVHSFIAYVSSQVHDASFRPNLHLTLAYGVLERCAMVPYRTPMPYLPDDVITKRDDATHGVGKLRVAVYDGFGSLASGVTNVRLELEPRADVYTAVVTDFDIDQHRLDAFDVVMFTGGTGGSQASSLGPEGREIVRQFLADGGGYVGICAGGYLAMYNYSWSLKIINAKTKSSQWARGEGTVQAEFHPNGQEILKTSVGLTDIHYANGPIMEPAGVEDLPPYEVLATFRTEMALNGTPVGIMVDSPAVIIAPYHKGRVMVISPHPEAWDQLRHMISGAVDWAGFRDIKPSVSLTNLGGTDIGLPSADYGLVLGAAGEGVGRPEARIAPASWTQVDGTAPAVFSPGPNDTTRVAFPAPGDYVLEARARNRLGQESSLPVTVRVGGTGTVNVAPITLATPDRVVATIPATLSLAGANSPTWRFVDGPASVSLPAAGATTGDVVFPGVGTYTIAADFETPDYAAWVNFAIPVDPLDFASWAAARGLDADPAAVPAGHHHPALVDYAFQIPASDAAAPATYLPQLTPDPEGHLELVFRRHIGAVGSPSDFTVAGLRYEVVFSTDLREQLTGNDIWEPVGEPTPNGDLTETVRLRTRNPVSTGFAWLRLSLE